MRGHSRHIWAQQAGGVGAEFALVVPLMLIFIFGIIDIGRAMWTWGQAAKATQYGVRYAVATDVIPPDLANMDFIGIVNEGEVIPESAFGKLVCERATCSCDTGPCYGIADMNSAAFDRMVERMQRMFPAIGTDNVRVDYRSSGLGYAGDPFGSDIAPLVTVRLVNMTFQPVTFLVFGQSIDLPGFPATLTLEDGTGALAN